MNFHQPSPLAAYAKTLAKAPRVPGKRSPSRVWMAEFLGNAMLKGRPVPRHNAWIHVGPDILAVTRSEGNDKAKEYWVTCRSFNKENARSNMACELQIRCGLAERPRKVLAVQVAQGWCVAVGFATMPSENGRIEISENRNGNFRGTIDGVPFNCVNQDNGRMKIRIHVEVTEWIDIERTAELE